MGSMGCHSSRISYDKLRIISIQLSDNPYPLDIANTKSVSASASAHNRIRIIHIRMDIKNSSPNSHNSDAEIIHTTFHPYLHMLEYSGRQRGLFSRHPALLLEYVRVVL
jgi:hypothetical protein